MIEYRVRNKCRNNDFNYLEDTLVNHENTKLSSQYMLLFQVVERAECTGCEIFFNTLLFTLMLNQETWQ